MIALNEGYFYVWFDTINRKYSRPFTKEDIEKYLDDKDLIRATRDRWALIEYRSLNEVQFEF